MAKHFQISIAAEAALDGIGPHQPAGRTLRCRRNGGAYKSLSGVEHAFRSLKTVDLELRPVFHWTAPRVVGAGDLGHIAVIKQRGLQRPILGRELPDRRSPQCGDPIQTSRAQCLLDARTGQLYQYDLWDRFMDGHIGGCI